MIQNAKTHYVKLIIGIYSSVKCAATINKIVLCFGVSYVHATGHERNRSKMRVRLKNNCFINSVSNQSKKVIAYTGA